MASTVPLFFVQHNPTNLLMQKLAAESYTCHEPKPSTMCSRLIIMLSQICFCVGGPPFGAPFEMTASDWSVEQWQKKELYMYLKQIINSYWSLLTNWSQTSSFLQFKPRLKGKNWNTIKVLQCFSYLGCEWELWRAGVKFVHVWDGCYKREGRLSFGQNQSRWGNGPEDRDLHPVWPPSGFQEQEISTWR